MELAKVADKVFKDCCASAHDVSQVEVEEEEVLMVNGDGRHERQEHSCSNSL